MDVEITAHAVAGQSWAEADAHDALFPHEVIPVASPGQRLRRTGRDGPRRTAEGKTPKEIRRCIKRYIARELYRTLITTMTLTDSPRVTF